MGDYGGNKMKGLQQGFDDAGGWDDPIMKGIKGLFGSGDDKTKEKPNAQMEAIQRKKQMQKQYETE